MNCEEYIDVIPEKIEEDICVQCEENEQQIDLKSECLTVRCPSSYEQLDDLPQIAGTTLIGNKTFEELGIENDKNYMHNQTTASDTWVITHNLNKLPSVSVIDSADEEVVGEITYDNINQLTIKFTAPFKGKATLN